MQAKFRAISKKYPRLYRTMAKRFGPVKAAKLIHSVEQATALYDETTVSSAFIWAGSPQGHEFWYSRFGI